MTNTTTPIQPLQNVRFGIAKAAPVIERWFEEGEDGIRFECEQNIYPDVAPFSVHTDCTASTYLDALLDAISLLRSHEDIPNMVAMVTVSDGTGRNFVSAGWETVASQVDYLLGIVRSL